MQNCKPIKRMGILNISILLMIYWWANPCQAHKFLSRGQNVAIVAISYIKVLTELERFFERSKKTLKRVKPLKKGLSRVDFLIWALKKGLKRADLLKRVLNWEVLLKRGLNWVGHSKKRSREERSYSKEGSGLNWVSHSKKCQREILQKNKKIFCDKKIEVSISGRGWQFLPFWYIYWIFL